MQISANSDFMRHWILASGFLTFVAGFGLFFLWTTQSISTWLLAISDFGIEAICKITISLSLYGIFLFHAKHNEFCFVGCWKLDDHVYRVKYIG